MVKRIYKNLYFDERTRRYFFSSGNDKREVVSQESYLLIYILENIIGGKKDALWK
jgi:hypothetical protein